MARTIYADIGGRERVEAVVEDFYDRVLADERLVGYFEDHDLERLYAHQVQFISAVAGGPVEYAGADVRAAHDHLDLDQRDFDAVVTCPEEALLENGVDPDHVESILAEVAALEDPILNR